MPIDSLGPVTIGAREIYDELKTVGGKVDRLDGKVEQTAGAHAELVADLADHETRIRNLERGRWPLPSLAALVAFASLILAILSFVATRGA
ncbi:hypothetical protein OG884_26450 [Streptosporangium sp. NBC_01755]|uniref:hypothetical protein n=1 Tax=Streptosporangium sp. NBC_01755 TaxID=2975949 RepID=UPI002DDBDD8F|nr:hypothetical protein [Streptosporangium sp. NBC_01755]WSC98390.1 hypothetical protein OG884_26450 [Streptosporangium sp. NBC_01755]